MEENVFSTIQNIFNQSLLLEKRIINILDNIKTETSQYDILLIEDDLATIRLLTSYFESKGFSCKGVVSGAKGLEEISNNPPKLVLLDIILPDYSGYDICKQIKSNKEYQDISVYLLTAIPGSEVEKHLKESIADGYILKPFDFSDFEVIFQYL
jgi:DNA-binding response OmpR family regulator